MAIQPKITLTDTKIFFEVKYLLASKIEKLKAIKVSSFSEENWLMKLNSLLLCGLNLLKMLSILLDKTTKMRLFQS